jgi:hypothetical protein
MHLAYAVQAGSEADYQQAVKLLADSRAAWKTLAETTDPVYAPLNNPLRHQKNFQWAQLLPSLETMDAAVASDFPRKADVPPLAFTPAEMGQDTGITVSDVRQVIDPAGKVQITCKAAGPSPIKTILLWYKNLPSEAGWQSRPMTGQGEFTATVPLTVVGLMYQIEARDESGQAAIFPPALKATPYWVIAPHELRGLNPPAATPRKTGQ